MAELPLPIVRVNPRRAYSRGFTGYRESDNDYIANNLDAVIELLDREVRRARNARRRAKKTASPVVGTEP